MASSVRSRILKICKLGALALAILVILAYPVPKLLRHKYVSLAVRIAELDVLYMKNIAPENDEVAESPWENISDELYSLSTLYLTSPRYFIWAWHAKMHKRQIDAAGKSAVKKWTPDADIAQDDLVALSEQIERIGELDALFKEFEPHFEELLPTEPKAALRAAQANFANSADDIDEGNIDVILDVATPGTEQTPNAEDLNPATFE